MWAAAGDALGFITELTDVKGLKWRARISTVRTTIPWRRSIGGKFGTVVELPAGAYSDDTQLRLATSRSIRSDGEFDVETFAKVELPVWLCYALGGGHSTKAAARAVGHPDVNWYSNFFEDKAVTYMGSGGNGAAMRIQPLVWASKGLTRDD
jgi:ADP-ribosylglycohydrolase